MNMTPEDQALGREFKRRIKDTSVNLAKLSRLSGVHLRTLRSLRNSNRLPRPLMVAMVGPFMEEAKEP